MAISDEPSLTDLTGPGRTVAAITPCGVNPGNNMVVVVDTGEEYQVTLAADPSLTIAEAAVVPLTAPIFLLGAGLLGLFSLRRGLRLS